MLQHPFRALGTMASLLVIGVVGWALTLGGYSLDDPELDDAGAWARSFRHDHREIAREIDKECVAAQTRSPWVRDGAMELFTCIRVKAEARGYYYE